MNTKLPVVYRNDIDPIWADNCLSCIEMTLTLFGQMNTKLPVVYSQRVPPFCLTVPRSGDHCGRAGYNGERDLQCHSDGLQVSPVNRAGGGGGRTMAEHGDLPQAAASQTV